MKSSPCYLFTPEIKQDCRPAKHFLGRSAGESEEKDVFGFYAKLDQMSDAVNNCTCLTGAGAGNHEMRAVNRCYRFVLRFVQFVFIINLKPLRVNDVQLVCRFFYYIFFQFPVSGSAPPLSVHTLTRRLIELISDKYNTASREIVFANIVLLIY